MTHAARPSPGWGPVADGQSERPVAKASLLDAVADLRRDVAATGFPLDLPGAERARDRRRALLDQLDDHLLPRLRELSAPGLVVVAGSTGAGKSTLTNSILGEEVSTAGVLRPTTRRPVLVHHPADAELLASHPLLDVVDVRSREAVPRGLALIDAPDLDSLVTENRTVAHRLLEAADLWVFVTTAARYGDALPWEILDRAAERGTSMAMVLNRVPADALTTVRTDLLGRLGARRMSTVPLFLIPDVGPHEGLLPDRAVAPIRRWLTVVAGPDRAQAVIARTQRGALTALRPWVTELADAVQEQVDARRHLEQVIAEAVAAPAERAAAAVRSGAVAEGPTRAAWAARSGRSGPLGGPWRARHRTARAAALADVRAELLGSVRVAIAAAERAARHALDTALADAPAGRAVVAAAHEAPAPHLGDGAEGWIADAVTRVGAAGRGGSKLVQAAGADGAGVTVACAAVGVGAARVVTEQALGRDDGRRLVDDVLDGLVARTRTHIEGVGSTYRTMLDAPDLADDAASLLLLRGAVLKEWA